MQCDDVSTVNVGVLLPQDLSESADAVDIWNAAVAMKACGLAQDQWIRGWRIQLVPRGSGRADLYICAPDMYPEGTTGRHEVPDLASQRLTPWTSRLTCC
jgi:hypothetical protein